MSDSQDEQLRPIADQDEQPGLVVDQHEQLGLVVDDILANDAEIRRGADAAGLEIDNLREVVLRRKDEVWEACLTELNAVGRLQSSREAREKEYRTRDEEDSLRRSWLLRTLWLNTAVGFLVAIATFILPSVRENSSLNETVRLISLIILSASGVMLISYTSQSRLSKRRSKNEREKEGANG